MNRAQIFELALALRKAFPLNWSMVRTYRLPQCTLGEPYYIRWEPGGGIYGEYWNSFDSEGVLRKGDYNPVSIAQYALHCYERAYAGDNDANARFMRQVRFLGDALQDDGSLRFEFGHSDFGLGPGWISGMSQGEASSVFLRAFALTNEQRYLDYAALALKPLERSTSAGGATYMHGNDVFFEEVPDVPTHILNGHLFAAFAVWEACEYGYASKELRELHEAALDTLARWMPLYDDRGWSFYDLSAGMNKQRHYVPITYHQIHIAQLRVYAAMTGNSVFSDMADRWQDGMADFHVRTRVICDAAQRLANSASRRARKAPVGPRHVIHGTAVDRSS